MKHRSISWACLVSTLACGGQGALDVGDEAGSAGQALSDYAARWDGYAEAFTFPGDGEDRVRLTLDENGAGVIRFGEEALFAAATDPSGLYPPTFSRTTGPGNAPAQSLRGLRSGFEFAVTGAAVSGQRLRFQANVGQVMSSWCALQSAEPVPGFRCGDGGSYSYGGADRICRTGAGTTEIDCDVAQQCEACQCDGEACQAPNYEWDTLEFDAALSAGGDTLEGTLVSGDERVSIRMQR